MINTTARTSLDFTTSFDETTSFDATDVTVTISETEAEEPMKILWWVAVLLVLLIVMTICSNILVIAAFAIEK